jgi:hypothetical protein
MTLAVGDLIQETTSTTGTGALTLSGAVAGYQSFAVIGTGNTIYYCIRSGTNKEVGIGTYTASGTTLSRDTVLYSSAGGTTKITVAAGATVINTYPAETSVSGGGGGTYPTVQPTLNLDFANTKLLDPRITFVRNSTAAYYDGQTTAMAEQNLLLQSQFVANWSQFNGTLTNNVVVAPDGTTTASTWVQTSSTAQLYQPVANSTLVPYTLSVYVSVPSGTLPFKLRIQTATALSSSILTATTTWQRFTFTGTPTTAIVSVSIDTDGTNFGTLNLAFAQLEQRSSATAYTPTTTAAITNYIPVLMTAPAGVARFDCDPITGKSLGLLIEESRTNLALQSAFASGWTLTRATTTLAAGIAPDGTQSAVLLVEDTSNNSHFLYQSATISTGTVYTCSVYAKAATRSYVALYTQGANAPANTFFNLSTGTIVSTSSGATSAITPVGNGWYRCSVTVTSGSTVLTFYPSISFDGITTSYQGNGYSGIYIWGAQVEAGSFATSLIPTVASTVTRAADQASMTGTNFSSWYNQAQGTMYCAANPYNTTGKIVFSISNSLGYPNSIYQVLGGQGFVVVYNGTAQTVLNGGVPLANTVNKIASSYAPNSFAVSLNAATVVASSTGSIPTVDRATIGGLASNTANQLNGTIQKISYYPVALSSSNLVALTS